MLKMLLDPMGGIVLTNDGNAILREVRNSDLSAIFSILHFLATDIALEAILNIKHKVYEA